MKKRLLSAFMALALCLTLLPTAALAEELGPVDGTSAVETAGADAEAAAKAEAEAAAKAEAEAKAKADAEAAAAVQAQIDALPDADELPAMDDDEVLAAYMAIQEAYDAYDALTAEQQAQITGAECFEALFGWFNGQIAPLADVTINPDGADANGDIVKDTSFDLTGPVLTENDTTLSGKYYIVQGDITISGDLTVDGSKEGGLVLCQGATLTVEGALIHSGGNGFYIYGQSNGGAAAGELIINNSSGGGAAIQSTSASAPRLGISSGKVTINGGSSKKLVDNVELYSTKPIHEGILDGDAKLPSEWGKSSISGGKLVIEYCGHDHPTYTPSGDTQHIKSCTQCGFNTGGSTLKANCGDDGAKGYVSDGADGHYQQCHCGNKFGTLEGHDTSYLLSNGNHKHIAGCGTCGYQSGSPEAHVWEGDGCKLCGFIPVATGDFDYIFESVQDALDALANGDTISAELYLRDSSKKEINQDVVFNYPGETLTLNMNGYTLENEGAPVITVEAGTLKITGAATIRQTATSQELVAPAIEVTGGELIFEDTLNVTGSAQNLSAAPAILVKGGTVKFEKDVTATAVENAGIDTVVASAIKATGGKLIFNGKLTATGGLGGVPNNTRPCEPAVYAEGGELEFNGDLDLNGGLTITGSAELTKGLTQGAFKVDYGSQTVNGKQLSVEGSSYAKVSDLLAEGYACVKTDSLAEGKEKEYANTRAYTCSDNVTIVKHEHEWKLDSQYPHLHSCACGKSENHEYDSSTGKCKICQSECSHSTVSNGSGGQESVWTCSDCRKQMLVESTASDGAKTYGTDFKAAMKAAENGTTVKLLADIKWGVAPQSRAEITGNGKIVTLNLNGHTITGGWIDIGDNNNPTSCTLKIIGEGGHESLEGMGGYSGVSPKATLDLSEWEGGTISSINISDSSNYEAATREAAVIVGPKAGTIGKLTFGNNQLDELKKTKLSGGSFNEIWAAAFGPVKLGELLAEGYAYQYTDGVDRFVEYTKTLQGESIYNVKVVKCPHGGAEGFDNNSTNCPYCNAPAVAETALNNGEGSSLWRRFANLQTAIDADRAGGAEFKLLTDVTGDYTINGTQNTALDLNGHSIKGTVTVKGIKGDRITTTLSNTQNTTTASIDKVVACDGAELAGSKYPAVIGELTLAEGATWKTILNGTALGYEVLNADGTHKWYAQDDVKVSQLNNVIINRLPITSKTLNLKVDGTNVKGNKVERGTTVQLCASCNAKDVTVTFSILKTGETTPITLSGNDVQYTTVGTGTTKFYVAEYAFNDVGSYTISFTATKDGYTVTSTPKKLTVTKPNLSNAVITFRSSNESTYEPYNSTTTAPGFTVTYNGKTLNLGVDYTASGTASSAGVSTQTLTIKAVEGSDYTGSKTAEWRIVPHKAKVEVGDVIKAYDGTTDLPDGKISLVSAAGSAGYQAGLPLPLSKGNGFELTDAKYDSANASETEKNISFTVKLTDTNYTFEDGTTEKAFTLNGAELEDKSFKINKAAAPTNIQSGTLNIINGTQQTYTYDFSKLLPELSESEYGTISYGNQPAISLVSQSGYYYDGTIVEFKNGVLILAQFYAKDGNMTGQIGTVKVNVTTTNYENFQLTLVLNAVNQIKPTPDGEITAAEITYGDALSKSTISGKMKDPNTGDEVKGTFTWQNPDTVLDASDLGSDAEWKFTPTDKAAYTEATGTATVKVDKARQYGKLSMTGYAYGQTPSTPTLTDRTGDGNAPVTYKCTTANGSFDQGWDIQNPPALNAGTYRMFARIGQTSNYYEYDVGYCEFVVAKATPTYTKPTGLTAKYGQTLADVTLPDGWSWMDSSESVGDASNAPKTFRAKFTPTDTANYNTVENIELGVTVNKADGGSLKTVELEQKYTDASDHTYTPDWLGLPGGQTWSYSSEYSVNNGSKATLTKQDIAAANGKLTYAISGGKAGDKITITLKASCNNYEDFTIILTITLTEKDNQQALRITGGTTVVYGQTLQLGTSGGSGSGAVTYTVTNGTGEATIDSDGVLTPVRIGSVTVTATKAGDSEYNAVTSSPVEITITRATPTGEPAYTKITASGKTLADAALGIGTITPAGGTIAWDDPTTTEVVANKSYGWTYTPTDTNYTTRTGTIKLWSKSSGGGSGRTVAVVAPDMPMLYRGGTGDAVKTLQEKLNAKGFDSGNVDGIFGAKTYAAVTAFQKANGLGVDGIVGKLTWGKLYDATPVNVTPVTTQPMLRTGSRGDAVRKLQEMLNAKGYTCGNVDGIFGSKTKAAVLAFQKANGLAADGIVGPLTWGKLV